MQIPPDSKNEDAMQALEYARRARESGMTDKGALFIAKAQAAYKDFMLWESAMKGARFQPRRRMGALSASTFYVYELSRSNPTLRVKALFDLADKAIIGAMAFKTFQNHVTKSRK